MSDQIDERFGRLVSSLRLLKIDPMELRSRKLGDMPPQGTEIQLQWNQAYAEGDPVSVEAATKVFRPKYEFSVQHAGKEVFHQTSIFVVAFSVTDSATFDELWADESLRKVFMERQLQRTMWPIFRQHAHDGMSRLGMQPVPLPWLM